MHEISVMQSAMEIAVEQAKANNAQHIHRVNMRVGALAGVPLLKGGSGEYSMPS